jgi:hypothetical protein
MRTRTAVLVSTLITAVLLPDVSHAQLSPQGLIGGITRPFRQALSSGHFPRSRHHHRGAAAASRGMLPATSNANETTAAGESRLGPVGPPAWPSAYEDVVGFTFWPDDYVSRLHGRGFEVIADTITGRFELSRRSARAATTGVAVKSDADNENALGCGDAASADNNWPAGRVEQILQLSDAQHASLEKLQLAAAQSVKNINADCRARGTLVAPERLRALVQSLWTVRDAGISMREPIKDFYDTLTNKQKSSFVSGQAQANPSPANPSPDQKAADNGMNKLYEACANQNVGRAERLIKEIEMKVRPNKEQASSLENFHKASTDMAKLLIASCAQPIPSDPMARLDAADDQLTAINYGASTVQIAFDNFYLKLSNEQKARLESPPR